MISIEKLTVKIPLSEDYKFLSLKSKLAINMLATSFWMISFGQALE